MGIGTLAAFLLAVPAMAANLPLLTRVEQVHRLTPEQAALGYPVHVRGVVTYREPAIASFYFQDASAGIYVEGKDAAATFRAGDAVEIRGYSSPGRFAPNIRDPQVTALGRGPWPKVRESTFEELSTGSKAAHWVRIRGVVETARINDRSQLELSVAAGPGRFQAVVDQLPAATDPSRLVDAAVRLSGVCATSFNRRRQFTGFRLRMPRLAELTVEEPPPADPFAVPVTPVEGLLRFRPEIGAAHRVRVQGVVTLCRPGQALYLRGGNLGLLAHTQQKDTLRPGDRVDVVGFPSLGEYAPVLRHSVFRKTGSEAPPAPVTADLKRAVAGEYDADLVRLEGVLLDSIVNTRAQRLVLRQGDAIFNADLPDHALAPVGLASRLQLTGICSVQVDENRDPRGFRLQLRGPEDIVVLARPSWWTLQRLAWLAAAMAVAVLGGALWVSILRRRVRQQTATIRHQLESEAALEQRYRDLFENATDVIYSRDLSGRLLWLNAAAERVCGISREKAAGMNVFALAAPEQREELRRWAERTQTGEDAGTREVDIVRPDGERRTLELSPRLICRDGRPERVDTIARDVTERRKADRELQRAKEAAEAASRAKSEFLANMSHEIRTPMNGVIGMAALVMETELDPQQREYLATIKQSADSLLEIINGILDFSKIEAGRLEPDTTDFSLRATLGETLRTLCPRAREKGLLLRCDVAPELPDALSGDAGRLRQVLLNLAGNAVKFTDRGEVAVEVACEQRDAAGCLLHFQVRDTGIGIPPEKQQSIFDAFVQADSSTRRKYGGTGLGLAISARLVALMGGRLWMESEPGRGSTFHFTARFCLCDRPAPAEAPVRGSCETAAARRLRILLAEDNAINQKVAARLLERLGHAVELAANGRAALEVFERGRFDLILMDVQMPEMDGFEATAAIRECERTAGGHTPIIALTAHAMKGDRERCLAAGMDGYVSKPLRPEELRGAIEDVLH